MANDDCIDLHHDLGVPFFNQNHKKEYGTERSDIYLNGPYLIRSDGNCFYDAVYQSAKFEGIIPLFSFLKTPLLQSIQRDEFSQLLREWISDNISFVLDEEDFNDLKEMIPREDLKEYGYDKYDSIGKIILAPSSKEQTFQKFKEGIKTNGTYVTEFEVKALAIQLGYIDEHHNQNYVLNNIKDACTNYTPGRINIYPHHSHYHAFAGSINWKKKGTSREAYLKSFLKYLTVKNRMTQTTLRHSHLPPTSSLKPSSKSVRKSLSPPPRPANSLKPKRFLNGGKKKTKKRKNRRRTKRRH